jgi:hypothetical protein
VSGPPAAGREAGQRVATAGFLNSVREYVFMTQVCGLGHADAAKAIGRSARRADDYRAYLAAHPEVLAGELAAYYGPPAEVEVISESERSPAKPGE